MSTNLEFDELINAVLGTYECTTKPQSDISQTQCADLIILLKCILETIIPRVMEIPKNKSQVVAPSHEGFKS